jgi:hypothetical protein
MFDDLHGNQPHRMVSCTERLWHVANQLYPPFANQLVFEGEGGTEGEFDRARWVEALRRVTEAQPGCRIRLRGFCRTSHWTPDGQPPRLRIVDGSRWNGQSAEGADFLREGLDADTGPVTEVLLLRGNPPRVIIRTLHAVMDGRGTILFAAGLFAALRGEAPPAAPVGPPTDGDIAATLTDRKSARLSRTSPLLTGTRRDHGLDTTWLRATVSGRVSKLLARFSLALARHAQVPDPEKIRFAYPVDLRRHRPDLQSNANLTALCIIPVGEYLTRDDPTQAFGQGILQAIERSEHASDTLNRSMLRDWPFWLMRLVGVVVRGPKLLATHDEHSGLISNLGYIDTAGFGAPDFKSHRVFFIPPMVGTMEAFATLTGYPGGVDICLGAPVALASEGRLKRLIDAVAQELRGLAQ